MSAVRLSDSENVEEYSLKIQSYVNDFNLCADTDSSSTGSGTMLKSKHTNYLMKGVPKNDDWRFFTQLIYDKIDTLADTPEEIIVKMKAPKGQLQKDDNAELAAMFFNLWTKNDKWNSKQTQMCRKSPDSNSGSNGISSESEKHHCRNWRDTQECYRCHQAGHNALYSPSSPQAERAAPTETAAATTTTPIEYYWMTVMIGESPSKKSWYLDCATTTHICGDQRKFK
jgi:hypothetical protein